MSRAGPCPGVCRRGRAGCRRPAPVPRLSAAGGPAGGWGGDRVARRGGAARMFPGGHRDGAAGRLGRDRPCSGQVRARGAPVRCLLAGWNLGRGNDGGLGMVGAVTGAVLMVGG